jgi:hypothetical protein
LAVAGEVNEHWFGENLVLLGAEGRIRPPSAQDGKHARLAPPLPSGIMLRECRESNCRSKVRLLDSHPLRAHHNTVEPTGALLLKCRTYRPHDLVPLSEHLTVATL